MDQKELNMAAAPKLPGTRELSVTAAAETAKALVQARYQVAKYDRRSMEDVRVKILRKQQCMPSQLEMIKRKGYPCGLLMKSLR